LPKVFGEVGIILGSMFLSLLAFVAYITVTFVLEAEATANAIMVLQKLNTSSKDADDADEDRLSNPKVADSVYLLQNAAAVENSKTKLKDEALYSGRLFEISERVELVKMAELFLGRAGVNWFLFFMAVYLFGDLTIYAGMSSSVVFF
jgi:hypothetical protein